VRVKILLAFLFVMAFSTSCLAQADEIHNAARSGDMEKLAELIAGDPELVNARDEEDHTALHSAVMGGQLDAVKFLLDNGADPDARNTANQSPLLYAAYMNFVEIVELLIDKGAPFYYWDTRQYTPLHFAARQGSVDVVKLLVEKGAKFDEPGFMGRTPLHFSALNGHTEIAVFLVEKGADPGKVDDDGLTPFQIALTRGHAETAEALLAVSGGMEFEEAMLTQYLNSAAAAGSQVIVDMLLAKGARPGGTDAGGRTILHNAVIGGMGELAAESIAGGVDVNAADGSGKTALFYAVSEGNNEMIDLLLRHGADPNIADSDGQTVLHIAEDNLRDDIVKALKVAGAVETERPIYPLTGGGSGTVEITYIANDGFMIVGGGRKILIDALHMNPWGFPETGERVFSMMLAGSPPFDGIDADIVSHAHSDHMTPAMHAGLLERDDRAIFLSSQIACDSLKMVAGEAFDGFAGRVVSVDPEWKEFGEVEANGVKLGFFGINHAGPGQEPYKTLATCMDVGGIYIAHLADQQAATSGDYYKAVDLKSRGVDIIFADRFFLADSIGQHVVREYIDPQYIILMHLRAEEVDPAWEELSPLYPNLIVFRNQLEKKIFAAKEE
jgi:ankyrin repeat protein/L-ascorbate metabolism protein UlaG (beta-lactamase superfamily)